MRLSDEKWAKHQENPNIMVRLADAPIVYGVRRSFHCDCGCNVFHHPSQDEGNKYVCNSCGITYTGE
jgi:hypothetical protein